jgi:hypothetical protein
VDDDPVAFGPAPHRDIAPAKRGRQEQSLFPHAASLKGLLGICARLNLAGVEARWARAPIMQLAMLVAFGKAISKPYY